MPLAQWRAHLPLLLYCALAFLLPGPFRLSALVLVILAAVTLVTANWRAIWHRLRARKALWPWLLFYVLHAASFFWSDDKVQAGADLESKLSFVLLPFALGCGPPIGVAGLRQIFTAFVAGMCAVALYGFGQGFLHWRHTGETSHFFYHQLVAGLEVNAVYMAWYTFFALCILLFGPERDERPFLGIWRWPATLLLLAFFVALSSRTLLVIFVLFPVPVFLVQRWKAQQSRTKKIVAAGTLVALVCGGLIAMPGAVLQRYKEISVKSGSSPWLADYSADPQQFNNMTTRLFVWRVGYDNLRGHNLLWLGAGVGDLHTLQNERMDELGIRDMRTAGPGRSHLYDVNLHNMYFQALLMLGLPGLLLLLAVVLPPFFVRWRHPGRTMWRMFSGVSAMFMLQEAALQTQAGIVFFSFFTCLLWSRYYTQKEVTLGRVC